MNIISRLDGTRDLVGMDLFTNSLLPAIVELASDSNWRVRLAIIENVPLIAERLGSSFFEDHLQNLSMSWMCDPVFSVRTAATKNLTRFTRIFGPEWSAKFVVPRVVEMISNPHYLYRMNAMTAVIVRCRRRDVCAARLRQWL